MGLEGTGRDWEQLNWEVLGDTGRYWDTVSSGVGGTGRDWECRR